jgi:hypothetical protein
MCIPKLIFKITIKQKRNFEDPSSMCVGHANLTSANSQAAILRISGGDSI